MLAEAIKIIRELLGGELVDFHGDYFSVDSARIWDLPDDPVEIGVSITGDRTIEVLGVLADHLINTAPDSDVVESWKRVRQPMGLPEGRVVGQLPICWDPDRDTAIARAHDQFRWFAGGWSVNADLPTPAGFAGATQFVRPQDVAEAMPCGPDLDPIVEAVGEYAKAGFTDVALIQIGGDSQDPFFADAAGPLLSALRSQWGD